MLRGQPRNQKWQPAKIMDFIGKYFGPNKIKTAWESKDKTYLGKPKVELEYENGETASYPLEIVEKLASDQPIDLTTLRDKRVEPVLEKILGILADSELTLDEIYYAVGPKLTASIEMSMDKCQNILWKGKELTSRYKTVTLMDMEKVLRQKSWTEKKKKS